MCAPRMRAAKSQQFLLFLSLFNSILGLSILFPILAPLGRELRLSEVQIGWLSTGYSLMQFVASPLWGRRSERIGRKPVLLTGIFGFGIGFGLFGLVAHLGMAGYIGGSTLFVALLATRLFGGLLSSATFPTAQAYMADVTDREHRTKGMALIGAAFGLGVVFGPGIGAALTPLGLLVPVYVSASVALLNGIFVSLRLPEPVRREHLDEFTPSAAVLARVWPILGIGLVVTLASVAMEQTVAFLYQDVLQLTTGNTAKTVGIALVCYGVAAVGAQGYLARKSGLTPLRLLLWGIPLSALGFLGLVFAASFSSLTSALAIQGIGQGLAVPGISAALSLAVGEREQGEVAGLNSASQALARTLGPVVGTSLYHFRPRLPFEFSVAILVLVFLVVVASPALRRQVSGAQAS